VEVVLLGLEVPLKKVTFAGLKLGEFGESKNFVKLLFAN